MRAVREKRHQIHRQKEDKEVEGIAFSDCPNLFRCVDLILPWLNSVELASISSSCKTLYRISKSVTLIRASDASRSLETLPIPFINQTLDLHPYAFFLYTASQTMSLPSDPPRQLWGSTLISYPISDRGVNRGWLDGPIENAGCECETCDASCSCCRLGWPDEMMIECGSGCSCEPGCGNRVTQKGIRVELRIVRNLRKGWGLHAAKMILCGQFICEYAGELLSTKEARRRQKLYDESGSANALLVAREHLPSQTACLRLNIDATRIGNVARFINHSCDGGNVSTRLVRCLGCLMPRVCLFASKDIREGEELTFRYGVIRKPEKDGLKPCFCGLSCCFGFLPSECT